MSEQYKVLGKLNLEPLEKAFSKIKSDEIIVTSERMEHIKMRHPNDYQLFLEHGADCVVKPDVIIKDIKHDETVFMVKKLYDTNINTIVRVSLENDEKGLKNSVMTFYRVRDKNLNKLINKNELLYKAE